MAGIDEGGAQATIEATIDEPGSATIRLGGEIDISNVDAVEAKVAPAVEQAHTRVVFDLGALSFLDSSGIAMLLRMSEHTESVEVHNVSDTVRLIIHATGLETVLRIADP